MPHLYDLNPKLKGKKKEPKIVKEKAPAKKSPVGQRRKADQC